MLWLQDQPLRDASALLEKKELTRAMQAVNRYLGDFPAHGGALTLKARILVEQGRSHEAIELFERVGASEPEDMHAWAKALLQQERWTQARPILEFVEQSGIDRADVLHELAACRVKLGDFENALKAAEEFALQPGCEVRGELLKGTLHQQRGNLRQAAAAWSTVLKLSPDGNDLQIAPAEFFLEYGRVLLAMGQPAQAAELIDRSLQLKEDPFAVVSRAEALSQLGKVDEARQAYELALSRDSQLLSARKGLANLALSEGKADQVLELLLPLENSPQLTSEIAFALQSAYVRLRDEETAKRWRDKADQLRKEESIKQAADQILRDTPDSDWATVVRAYKYAMAGNWSEAETLLNSLGPTAQKQQFVHDLTVAVKSRSELPSLLGLPVRDR